MLRTIRFVYLLWIGILFRSLGVNARIFNSPIALPSDQCTTDLTTLPLSIVHSLTLTLLEESNLLGLHELFRSSSSVPYTLRNSSLVQYICNPEDIQRITRDNRIIILLNTGLWSTDLLNSYLQLSTLTKRNISTDASLLSSFAYIQLPTVSALLQQVYIHQHYRLCAVPSILEKPLVFVREDYYNENIEDTLLYSRSYLFSVHYDQGILSINSQQFALCIARSIAVTASQYNYFRSYDSNANVYTSLSPNSNTTSSFSSSPYSVGSGNGLPYTWGIRLIQTKGPRYLSFMIQKYLYSLKSIRSLLEAYDKNFVPNHANDDRPTTTDDSIMFSSTVPDTSCPSSVLNEASALNYHHRMWTSKLITHMNTPLTTDPLSILPYLELLSSDLHSLKVLIQNNTINCVNRTYLVEFLRTVRYICRSTLYQDEPIAAHTEWLKDTERYADILHSLGLLLPISLITQTDIFSVCLRNPIVSTVLLSPNDRFSSTILDKYSLSIGCIPSASTSNFPSTIDPYICTPELLWSTAKDILIPYAFRVVGGASFGLLSDPFLYYEIGSFLNYGLTYNASFLLPSSSPVSLASILGVPKNLTFLPIDWHPTGWPAVETPLDQISVVPQTTYYFAISYYYAALEKSFKSAMHNRIGYTVPRSPAIIYQAQIHPTVSILPFFNSSAYSVVTGTACMYPILIISSFWDKGHSSHRITAPLIEALAYQSNVCLYLLYLYKEGMVLDSLSIFQQTIPYTLPAEDYSGALALYNHLERQLHSLCFHGIIYPSIGMVPIDITLISLQHIQCALNHSTNIVDMDASFFSSSTRVSNFQPIQMVMYGHSVSTYASNADIFVGGFEPEVLGPVSSDIYDNLEYPTDSCSVMSATLQTLTAALLQSRNSPFLSSSIGDRYPLMIFCEETNRTSNASSLRCIPQSTYVGNNSTESVLLSPSLIELYQNISRSCRTTFPTDITLFSATLNQRLIDAQKRYTERLFLLPGLGLWFTDMFPTMGEKVKVHPFSETLPHSPVMSLAKVWKNLAELPFDRIVPSSLSTIDTITGIMNTTVIPFYGNSHDNPVRIGLVWSLVKWNAVHVQKLRLLLHGIQSKFYYLWNKCTIWLKSSSSSSLKSSVSTLLSTVCSLLKKKFPQPYLYLRIHAFTHMNIFQEGLQTLAAMRTIHTLVISEFLANATIYPSTYVELTFEYNASEAHNYMKRLSTMHILIDSLPFSACNTMQDALSLGIPIVGLHHDNVFEPSTISPIRWRSSIGACMLTKAGLTGLVALNEDEWYHKNIQLITNPFLHYLWKVRMEQNDDWKRIMDKERSERDAAWIRSLVQYGIPEDNHRFQTTNGRV